ncbi:hypothetical protein OH77DRAFT_29634 [Trametes cingulata]|nr:hypothetical protein OH77DRAFT_29634 [Trametes cingulata]
MSTLALMLSTCSLLPLLLLVSAPAACTSWNMFGAATLSDGCSYSCAWPHLNALQGIGVWPRHRLTALMANKYIRLSFPDRTLSSASSHNEAQSVPPMISLEKKGFYSSHPNTRPKEKTLNGPDAGYVMWSSRHPSSGRIDPAFAKPAYRARCICT